MFFRIAVGVAGLWAVAGLSGCSTNGSGLTGSGTNCPGGQILCGGLCATLGDDPNNCGACGAACAAGQGCVGGVCEVVCGTGATSCPTDAGQSVCVNLKSDDRNCGACGHACPSGQACNGLAGCAASCPAGENLCGTLCSNPLTDPGNCGHCGNACVAGEVCSAGLCQENCAANYTTCVTGLDGGADGGTSDAGPAAYCANLRNDPNNCGACGNICGQGSACCAAAASASCIDILNDRANCGACGHDCQGLACQQGLCATTTLAGGFNPSAIQVDSTYIYFTATFSVNQMLTDGGGLIQVSQGSFSPQSVTVNAQNIYWADTTGVVWDTPIVNDGGQSATFVGFPLPLPSPVPFGTSVDESNVFYAGYVDGGSPPWCSGSGCILSVPLSGFGFNALATGEFLPNGIAIDAQRVYWTDVLGGTVMMANKSGGGLQTLATGQGWPAGIATDSLNVYWADTAKGTVNKRPLDGGAAQTLASGLTSPSRVAVDSSYVYWTDHDAGTVARVGISGGGVVVLADQQKGPIGLALDASHVYWTNNGGAIGTGNVTRIPK